MCVPKKRYFQRVPVQKLDIHAQPKGKTWKHEATMRFCPLTIDGGTGGAKGLKPPQYFKLFRHFD